MRTFVAVVVLSAVNLSVGVSPVFGQAEVDLDWAQQFVGGWELSLETPEGALAMAVTVRADDGKIVLDLDSALGTTTITAVARSDDGFLVGSYELEYEGTMIPAVISLKRDGDGLATDWSFADGLYETSAKATRKGSS